MLKRIMGSTWSRLSDGPPQQPIRQRESQELDETLKIEAVYPMAYATFANDALDLPRFINQDCNANRLHSANGYRNLSHFED